MNRKIAKFEILSDTEILKLGSPQDLENFKKSIKLPKRATSKSAGYDFYTTEPICLLPGESFVVKTFIRCKMEKGWMLSLFPRSGQGFKNFIGLANTVGIIDADYYEASNEGHIMIKLVNWHPSKTFECSDGDAIAQGVFIPHGVTIDDEANGKRYGGFGSTDKKGS